MFFEMMENHHHAHFLRLQIAFTNTHLPFPPLCISRSLFNADMILKIPLLFQIHDQVYCIKTNNIIFAAHFYDFLVMFFMQICSYNLTCMPNVDLKRMPTYSL